MNWKKIFLGTSLLAVIALSSGILTGCASHNGYATRPDPGPTEEENYVYYPDYGIYYAQNRHQYLYLEDNIWTTSSTPEKLSVEMLSSARSVQMPFHDAPEAHHAEVLRKYPGRARDPGMGNGYGENVTSGDRN